MQMEPSLSELLISGLKLMFLGMSIVFTFLALLVWIIGVIAKLVRRYTEPSQPVKRAEQGHAPDESETVAILAAAIQRFRGR